MRMTSTKKKEPRKKFITYFCVDNKHWKTTKKNDEEKIKIKWKILTFAKQNSS